MRDYLDPVVKADQCVQYDDDIGIAANIATELTRNIRAVFKCIRQAGLKLTIEKCHFGVREVEFLGRTISTEGISSQARKIQNFLDKLRFPKSKKTLQRYLGFVNYYKNCIPRMAEKLNPFFKLLKTEVPINITSELKETFHSVNKALSDACELALKQSIPRKQLVLMADASFRSARHAFMIEDNPDHKIQTKRKTYTHVAFGSKVFCPVQIKMSIYSKKFWHLIWQCSSLHTFCERQRSQKFLYQITNLSHVFSKEGISASYVACMWLCVAIFFSKYHTLPDLSTLLLTFSPNWNSMSQKR